jgi:ketosteroid isomerase-like protein
MIESKIKDLENQLVEAIKKSDIAILDQMLHNDLLFLAPNGQLITKAMDIASHQAGQMIVEELILTIEEINIINDNAIAIVVYSTKGTMLGNPIQGQFRYIRMWKQFTDGIKVIGGSCIQI